MIDIDEFLTWQAFLDDEQNTPDRSDYYLAQIAAEVRRLSGARNVKLSNFLHPVKFVRKKIERAVKMTKKQDADRVKSLFFGMTGYKRK